MFRVLLAFMVLGFGASQGACFDESDACKAYCRMAADCQDCGGGTADIPRCQAECVDLTFAQQQDLSTCASDCANLASCRLLIDQNPPSPCNYGP